MCGMLCLGDLKCAVHVWVFHQSHLSLQREGWPPNGAHPVGVTYMLDLFQEVRDCREVWDAVDKAKKNVWFAEV